jgi:hypothetical protein
MGLDESPQRGLIIGIKMAQFNVTKSQVDKRTMLERVGMAAKWNSDQKCGKVKVLPTVKFSQAG